MGFYKIKPLPEFAKECAARLREAVYEPLEAFKITVWRSPEPLDFLHRMEGAKRDVRIGDRWADELFDCGWFHFEARCPILSGEKLFAIIDVNGELCLVDESGVPVRGLTSAKSFFEPAFGEAAKLSFEIDHSFHGGMLSLWADAGFNDLFGVVQDGGLIRRAGIYRRREDIRALYYDVETLIDYYEAVSGRDQEREMFINALLEISRYPLTSDPSAISAARERMAVFFKTDDGVRKLEISAIGHAHLDLAWLWPIRETLRKNVRTFSTALYNIERYPEYLYGCSQAQLFSWLKQSSPVLYERVRAEIRSGRIEPLGAFWVEPDCNLLSGESLVRQILYGRRFFIEEFGMAPDFCWQPDVFGYNGQLPQILSKSGQKYFMTQKLSWNVVNRFPHQSFNWRGIDGSAVLVHMLPEETYNSPSAPRTMHHVGENYLQKDVSSHALVVFGIGDGGGGPDAEHLERLRRVNSLEDLPRVTQRRAAEFFPLWAQEASEFPVWAGELYLERHQGTFTTQGRVKKWNRRCEVLLYELELLAVWSQLIGGKPYPTETIEGVWKEVLLYQFHDILPGSSIERVYAEVNSRYEALLLQLEALVAEYSQQVVRGGAPMALNCTSWPRREWVRHNDCWHFVTVPGLGFSPLTSACLESLTTADVDTISNDVIEVKFAADGTISSLLDVKAGVQFALAHGGINQLLGFQDHGDAWDFDIDYTTSDIWRYLDQDPIKAELIEQRAFMDGPVATLHQRFALRSSSIEATITLAPGERQLRIDMLIDWKDPGWMLRSKFPFSLNETRSRSEIPFGSIDRSTGEVESRERAQIEVPALQWVSIFDEERGVALLNDCKYGFRLKGNVIDMNILRSVPYPGKATIDATGHAMVGKSEKFTDLGVHRLSYVVLPFEGSPDLSDISAKARALNVPLRIVEPIAADQLVKQMLFTVDDSRVEIVAIKQAESGEGVIVRAANLTEGQLVCSIDSGVRFSEVWETNLVESMEGPVGDLSRLNFGPFEVKTYLLKY